jgi:hypothetical protein
MTEREYSAVNTEDTLTRQIKLMDKFRETMEVASQRIITAESCLELLGDRRDELRKENEALKKKIAEYEAKALEDEDPEELTLYNTDGEEITVEEWEARAVKKVKEARAARWSRSIVRHFHLHASPGSRSVRKLPFIVID